MEKFATLIGPIASDIRDRAFLFAKHICHVQELDVISDPGIHEVLAGDWYAEMSANMLCAKREIVRTRASYSVHVHGSRECVLLTRLQKNAGSRDTSSYLKMLRFEYAQVKNWRLFNEDKVRFAFVLPDLTLQEIEL